MLHGFFSAEQEYNMMREHPQLWKEWVKRFGHHKDFKFKGRGGNKSSTSRRRVGGVKKSPKRRVLKYGRKK